MTQKRRKPEGYDDMTHDELLAEIDRRIGAVNKAFYIPNTGALEIRDLLISNLLTLRAVVELHKPDKEGLCAMNCVEEDDDECAWTHCAYPCPTVQAIEKLVK